VQEIRIINEPDLFRLVVHSRLPEAERFEQWVFEEVLSLVRKQGSYAFPDATPKHLQELVSAIVWL
jgi:prophage antirepressor-like protein